MIGFFDFVKITKNHQEDLFQWNVYFSSVTRLRVQYYLFVLARVIILIGDRLMIWWNVAKPYIKLSFHDYMRFILRRTFVRYLTWKCTKRMKITDNRVIKRKLIFLKPWCYFQIITYPYFLHRNHIILSIYLGTSMIHKMFNAYQSLHV